VAGERGGPDRLLGEGLILLERLGGGVGVLCHVTMTVNGLGKIDLEKEKRTQLVSPGRRGRRRSSHRPPGRVNGVIRPAEGGPMGEVALEDLVLGSLSWDRDCWRFRLRLPGGRECRGSLPAPVTKSLPAGPPPPEEQLVAARRWAAWLRDNEVAARRRLAERMFPGWRSGWYDPEIDRTRTPTGFGRKLRLLAVDVRSDGRADLTYSDGGLFGGHGIAVLLDEDGGIEGEPYLFG
jgi:hypothetical protein